MTEIGDQAATLVNPWLFEPGVHDNVPIERYHAMRALSSSGVKKLLRSPAHYLFERQRQHVQTESMRVGTAIHLLCIEPHRLDELIVHPKFDRRTKAGQIAAATWEQQHPNRDLAFDEPTYERIRRSVDAVQSHPGARERIEAGTPERSLFWRDAALNVECRARMDLHLPDMRIVDLKSTIDASAAGFEREIGKYQYHVSAAWYWIGHEHVFDESPTGWEFIAVEHEPPYGVAVYSLDMASIRAGMDACDVAIKRFANALVAGRFTCYSTETQPISAPQWAVRSALANF